MHLGAGRNLLQQTQRGDSPIDGDAQPRAQLVTRAEAIANAGEPPFKSHDNLPHSGALNFDFGLAAGRVS
jgi:hypothetical protein